MATSTNSSGPLGTGEIPYPQNKGNALLVTRTLNGAEVNNWLWLANFATDLNLQINTGQLRAGLTYRPIRMAERYLTFSALWNVKDREKYLKLVENIRKHWTYNLNEDQLTPMTLTYYGANKTWQGFIENANISYAVTDVILSYDFRMRLIMKSTETVAEMMNPVSSPVSVYASDVYSFQDFHTPQELYTIAGLENLNSSAGGAINSRTSKQQTEVSRAAKLAKETRL